MLSFTATRTLDVPADLAWALIADYSRDPDWRRGVLEMTSQPPGPAVAGAVTSEVLRVAGRTYRNVGLVERVLPGRRLEWRTTSGAVAHGSREVRAVGAGRCAVTLELHVEPRGAERLLTPVFRKILAKGLVDDLGRLADLAAVARPPVPSA